jgi:hypothetical protein
LKQPKPDIQVGDRVVHVKMNQHANVLEVLMGRVHLHWGTEWNKPVTSWHDIDEVQKVAKP